MGILGLRLWFCFRLSEQAVSSLFGVISMRPDCLGFMRVTGWTADLG